MAATPEERKRIEDEVRTRLMAEEYGSFKIECVGRHDTINGQLTDIKVSIGQFNERFKTIFGDLEEGDGYFKGLEKRMQAVEKQQEKWKGWLLGISAATSVFTAFLIKVVFPHIRF